MRTTVIDTQLTRHASDVNLESPFKISAFRTFDVSETRYKKSEVRDILCRGKPKLRRFDQRASPAGEPDTAPPRAACACTPGDSKLGRKPEAFPPRALSP